jgi:hypothetical protein
MSESLNRFNRRIRTVNEAAKRRQPVADEVSAGVGRELSLRLGKESLVGTVRGVIDGVSKDEVQEAGLSID